MNAAIGSGANVMTSSFEELEFSGGYLLDNSVEGFFANCWKCEIRDSNPWIQIGTNHPKRWKLIQIQGRHQPDALCSNCNDFVTKIKIKYTIDGIEWLWDNHEIEYDTNLINNSDKKNITIGAPFIARALRIYPTQTFESENQKQMRVEAYYEELENKEILIFLNDDKEINAINTGASVEFSSFLNIGNTFRYNINLQQQIDLYHGFNGWDAKLNDQEKWSQIGVNSLKHWTKFEVTGKLYEDAGVVLAQINYTKNGIDWLYYNTFSLDHPAQITVNTFDSPILAKAIRIIIIQFETSPSMRFDAYYKECNETNSLANYPGKSAAIGSGAHVEASSYKGEDYMRTYRLGSTQMSANSNSGWLKSEEDHHSYIQIGLNELKLWTEIEIQGRGMDNYCKQCNQYVTLFQIQYSIDGINFHFADNGKKYQGNNGNFDEVASREFDAPFYAKSIRIIPTDYNGVPTLRVEAYYKDYKCNWKCNTCIFENEIENCFECSSSVGVVSFKNIDDTYSCSCQDDRLEDVEGQKCLDCKLIIILIKLTFITNKEYLIKVHI